MTLKFHSMTSSVMLSLVLLTALLMSSVPAASAQGSSDYVLDKSTYQAVQKIQKLMGNEKYSAAISRAKDLLPNVKDESDYAYALTNQLIGNAYLIQGNYNAAQGYLETARKLNALQPRSQRSIVVQLATIYLSQKQYQKSIELYKDVIAQAKKKNKGGKKQAVKPELYYHLGLAYSFADEYGQAYSYIHKAIVKRQNMPARTNEKGEKVEPEPVPKDWYQNLFIVVYKQHKYDKANGIAKSLVAKWPGDKTFWLYYANTYLLLKEDEKALNVYALMYKKGMLSSKEEQMQLVSLLVEASAPYKAATRLQKFMNEGAIPKDKDNYSLLSSLWMQAKEWDDALNALGEQAKLESSGDIYLRQAAIYMSKLQYRNAMHAARQAISKGGLDEPGQAWMILGQAAYRANETHTALEAFHRAADYSGHRKDAQGWIKFVKTSTEGSG